MRLYQRLLTYNEAETPRVYLVRGKPVYMDSTQLARQDVTIGCRWIAGIYPACEEHGDDARATMNCARSVPNRLSAFEATPGCGFAERWSDL